MFLAGHHSLKISQDLQPSPQEPGIQTIRIFPTPNTTDTLFPSIKNCKSAAGFERSDQHSTRACWPLDITVRETFSRGLPFSGWTEIEQGLGKAENRFFHKLGGVGDAIPFNWKIQKKIVPLKFNTTPFVGSSNIVEFRCWHEKRS